MRRSRALALGGRNAAFLKLVALALGLLGIHSGGHRVLDAGDAPTWNADGSRLAYAMRGNLWVADADGSRRTLLVAQADDPAWAPDGRHIAFTRATAVWIARGDGLDERRTRARRTSRVVTRRRLIAYDDGSRIKTKRADGFGRPRLFGSGHDRRTHPPAGSSWADGQIFVDGKPVTTIAADAYAPSVSPGGGRIAYVDDGRLFSAGIDGSAPRLLGRGYQPAWRPKPSVRELLPDFDQRAPSGLTITRDDRGRWKLGFRSAVANMGTGVFHVAASRRLAEPVMHAAQKVALAHGGTRTYPGAGPLRYVSADNHVALLAVRDLRAALARRPPARGRPQVRLLHGRPPPHERTRVPAVSRELRHRRPSATHLEEGSSVGYADIYPPYFHGLNAALPEP